MNENRREKTMRYIKLNIEPDFDHEEPCKAIVNWDAVKWAKTVPKPYRYPTTVCFATTVMMCKETTDQIAEQLDTLEG